MSLQNAAVKVFIKPRLQGYVAEVNFSKLKSYRIPYSFKLLTIYFKSRCRLFPGFH